MVIALGTIWMLKRLHGTPGRNFSFPQIPQSFADFSCVDLRNQRHQPPNKKRW